jgi:hypothetical protein
MIIAQFDTKAATLLKILGVAIILIAAVHLLIGLINISNQDFLINLIDKNYQGNREYYFSFMPFLLMIGLSYLILGIRLPKLKSKMLVSHIVISISLIIWAICWVLFNSLVKKDQGQETNTDLISTITGFIIILIPQIIIGNKLYKLEKGINAA